jgi:predicted nucleic acid-binding protein
VKYLLDTNVLKEIGKPGSHRNVVAWLDTVDDIELAIGVISVREICKGIEKKRSKNEVLGDRLEHVANGIFEAFQGRILGIDEHIARQWGKLLAQSERHVDDTGLAAIAAIHGLTVVTRNVTDFKGRGVDVLDPFIKPAKLIKA